MVVFRVDSSAQIGSGHLMRCLTLAGQLKKEKQTEIFFISRDLEGNLNHLIENQGYHLLVLPRVLLNEELEGYDKWLTVTQAFDASQTEQLLQGLSVDYLILDSYAFDETWENILRPCVKKIMVIDDLANRKHNCDILLDQNYYCDMTSRYTGLVPKHCQMLLGPQHALLREEFYEARKKMRKRDGHIKNILVFFGSSDLTNETLKTLRALEALQRTDIQINVVVGASNNHKESIEVYCQNHDHIQYFCQVSHMAELMNEADLAIGAGGTTTWERCFLGLPAILIAIADNQVKICEDCSKRGIIRYAGRADRVDVESLRVCIQNLLNNKTEIKRMQQQIELLFGNVSVIGLMFDKRLFANKYR